MTAKKPASQHAANSLKPRGAIEMNGDGSGTIETPETFDDNADFASMLRMFGVNPDKVIVKGDTIRVSARQVVTVDEYTGEETVRVARSFSAAFMPRPASWIDEDELTAIGAALRSRGTKKTRTPKRNPVTYFIALADLQLGKSEGGGIAATLDRFNAAFDAALENLETLRASGVNVEKIALAQMGDVIEGCDSNYASQTFTVEANQRRQLRIALDVLVSAVDRALETGLPVHFVSVHSNHGQWMRRAGSKGNITSESDTSDGALHDSLKTVFRREARVSFTELNDEAVITVNLSGVNVALSHGHLTTAARAEAWLDSQARVQERLNGVPVDVFVTAHSHHFRQQDLGAYQWFQCPALDGGSKWFQDARGRWSTAGVLTMVLGAHLPVKVAHVTPQWAVRGDR